MLEAKENYNDSIEPSPIEDQIAFIAEIIKDKEKIEVFLKDPVQFSMDHGTIISPDIAKKLTNFVLKDAVLEEDLIKNIDLKALGGINDIKGINEICPYTAGSMEDVAKVVKDMCDKAMRSKYPTEYHSDWSKKLS